MKAENYSFTNLRYDSINNMRTMYFLYVDKFSIKVIASGKIPCEYKSYVDEILSVYRKKSKAVAFFFAYNPRNTLEKCYISKSGTIDFTPPSESKSFGIDFQVIPTTRDKHGAFDATKCGADLLYYAFEEYLKKSEPVSLTLGERKVKADVELNGNAYDSYYSAFKASYPLEILEDNKVRLLRSLVLQTEIGFFIRLFSFKSDYYLNDMARISKEGQDMRNKLYEDILLTWFNDKERKAYYETTSNNLLDCLRIFNLRKDAIYGDLVQCAEDSLITYMGEHRDEFQMYHKYTLFTIYFYKGDEEAIIIHPCRLCSTHLNSDICEKLVKDTYSYDMHFYNQMDGASKFMFQSSTR